MNDIVEVTKVLIRLTCLGLKSPAILHCTASQGDFVQPRGIQILKDSSESRPFFVFIYYVTTIAKQLLSL